MSVIEAKHLASSTKKITCLCNKLKAWHIFISDLN